MRASLLLLLFWPFKGALFGGESCIVTCSVFCRGKCAHVDDTANYSIAVTLRMRCNGSLSKARRQCTTYMVIWLRVTVLCVHRSPWRSLFVYRPVYCDNEFTMDTRIHSQGTSTWGLTCLSYGAHRSRLRRAFSRVDKINFTKPKCFNIAAATHAFK